MNPHRTIRATEAALIVGALIVPPAVLYAFPARPPLIDRHAHAAPIALPPPAISSTVATGVHGEPLHAVQTASMVASGVVRAADRAAKVRSCQS